MVKTSDDFLKSLCLEWDLVDQYNKAWRKAYKGDDTDLKAFKAKYGPEITRVCKNLAVGEYKRFKKVFKRMKKYCEGGRAIFATLTFNSKALTRKRQTRRVNVARCCKAFSDAYVANIDFGDKQGREHYHAIMKIPEGLEIVSLPEWKNGKMIKVPYIVNEDGTTTPLVSLPCFDWWREHMGFIDLVKVGDEEKDAKRTCRYTVKLARHAIKSSTWGKGTAPRIIYSRRVAKDVDKQYNSLALIDH